MLAPNAALREAVTASAGPAGATLQLLEQARASMGLPSAQAQPAASAAESDPSSPLSPLRRTAVRCWALLLVRIFEHIGEPTQPPVVRPARPRPG